MTKLGIKTNTLAMLMCIVGLVSGYVGALLMAGYILLSESDRMLRRTAIRTLVVMCLASLLIEVVDLLPETITWISSLLSLFNGSLYIGFLSALCNVLVGAVRLAESVILLLMAYNAYKGKELSVKKIDAFIDGIQKRADTKVTTEVDVFSAEDEL